MYRNFSFAAALLAMMLSGQVLATGINSFSQAKTAGVKVNADVPGDFYCGCKINWQGKKGVVDLASCGYKVRKMKTAPAALNGNTSCPPGSSATSVSVGRTAGEKTVRKILSTARWRATCTICNPPSAR